MTDLRRCGQVLAWAVDRLTAAGCETPRLDAEVLVAGALGLDRAALLADPARELAPAALEAVAERIGRRAGRQPVAYITGRRAFRRLELEVDPRVLIPRPETELLVEIAVGLPAAARVQDVGTGSGAVALAIKDERPDLAVSGSDASSAAIDVARANASRLGLDVPFAVLPGLPSGRFDLVVANLPYVREDEWSGLQPEIVRHEPREALVSGLDGLDAIRAVVSQAPSGTRLALEHAPGQGPAVRALLRAPETRRDLAGRERVTIGTAP